jgi:NADH:ubiquinone oxidoreductase subunit K
MIGLPHYILFGSILFSIGVFGVLTRRNAIGVLMSLELILNSVNINLVAANKFVAASAAVGQLLAVFVIVVAAAEIAVGIALVISIYRQRRSVDLNNFNLLKW